MDLAGSVTLTNLMRAFAGESQARNRYTFAAQAARSQALQVLEAAFLYTAGQEKEHAELFYARLAASGVANVEITGGYPVDGNSDALFLLRAAHHNEYEEFRIIYPDFADTARREGFPDIGQLFSGIAAIEKTHGDRFQLLADQLQAGQLFSAGENQKWVCLNCGNVFTGSEAPAVCPVCYHDRGYFVRSAYAPYSGS